jgi:hypothetical protein
MTTETRERRTRRRGDSETRKHGNDGLGDDGLGNTGTTDSET